MFHMRCYYMNIWMKVAMMWIVLNQHPSIKPKVVKIHWLCYNLQQIHSHKGWCHLQSFILHQSFLQLQTFYMHAKLLLCIQSSSVFDSLSSDCKKSTLSPYLKQSSPHADSRCVCILRTLPDRLFLWEKRECDKKRGLPLNPGWLGKKLFSDIFRAMNVSVIQQRLNRFLRIHRACRKQCICSVEKRIGDLLWRREGKYSLRNTHVMQDKCLSFLLTMTYILLKGIVHTKLRFCHYSLNLVMIQTSLMVFLTWKTKRVI